MMWPEARGVTLLTGISLLASGISGPASVCITCRAIYAVKLLILTHEESATADPAHGLHDP
jgi:hypothetical protein